MELSINNLIKSKTPFAIVQYNEWFKSTASLKEVKKKYMVLLNGDMIKYKGNDNRKYTYEYELLKKNILEFKNNINLFRKVIDDKDGCVYEYLNFKKQLEEKIFELKIKN